MPGKHVFSSPSLLKFFFFKPIFIIFIIIPCLIHGIFRLNALALSIEEENILGQQFLSQIRKQCELLEDDYANRFINDLGQYLTLSLEVKHFPFKFYIIKDSSLNAFAAPGGHIFFYSGLIEAMDTVDQLAGVMAHEIGHVFARHLSNRIEQGKKIGLATMAGVLAGVLIGGEAAEAMITGSMAGSIQTQLHYSRNDERHADQLGFKYATQAGFEPAGLLLALGKIEKAHLGINTTPPYFLTHPTGPERMSNLDSMISNYIPGTDKKEVKKIRNLFPFFKTICNATCFDLNESISFFKASLKKSPVDLNHFGLGIALKRNSEDLKAINHFNKAIKLETDLSQILTYLGEAYQKAGQYHNAITVLKKRLKQNSGDKTALLFLGISYEGLEQYEKAIKIYKKLVSLKPVKNMIFYHLGICYGKEERLALAHYYFGIYFKKIKEISKAFFHLNRSEKLAQNDKALLKKIIAVKNNIPINKKVPRKLK